MTTQIITANGSIITTLESMQQGISVTLGKLFGRDFDFNETDESELGGGDGVLKKRDYPWFTTTYTDANAFAYWMFTDVKVTSGSGTQTLRMLVDTGSSDTYLTSPGVTSGWKLVDSTSRSISYGYGTVSGIQMYTIPTVTYGSTVINNFAVGYSPNRPSFLNKLSSSPLASGIFGLGAYTTVLSSLPSQGWESACTIKAYQLNTYYLNLCSFLPSSASTKDFPFYSGTERPAIKTTAIITVGSSTFSVTPQPMLFDTGSAYIVVDDTVASAVATALALKVKRSDDHVVELKKTSRQFNL
ncbi:hypothetical protein HK096_004587 [Nowakowskiella sp. JEL0078]|nr:hypothetical protein HK096_004587 [Nowakowskiella sp. JEL0078]